MIVIVFNMRVPTMGEKLAAWRTAQDLKQREAAKAAGISQALWSRLEEGRMKRVGLEIARRIVEVTSGAIVLEDFPRPRGKKVRPPTPPDSTISVAGDGPDDESLHARDGAA